MPATTVSALDCCLKTEQELMNIKSGLYGIAELEGQGETFGTLRFLNDVTSVTGFNKVQVQLPYDKSRPGDANCTDRDVRIKYLVPECCEESADDPDCDAYIDCTTVAAARETWAAETVPVENCTYDEFTIAYSEYECSCEDPRQGIAIALARAVRRFARKYQSDIRALLVASAGSTYLGSVSTAGAPIPLKIFRAGTNLELIPQPAAWYEIQYEYDRQSPNSGTTPYILTGSKALGAYQFQRSLYNNNEDGSNINAVGLPYRFYNDWELNADLAGVATDPLLSVLPGSLDVLEWYRYWNPDMQVGPDGRVVWAPVLVNSGEGIVRQMIDVGTPILGFPLTADVQIMVSACDQTVTYKMKKNWGFWTPPADAFCGTYNFRLLYNIACDTYGCADIVSPTENCPEPVVIP